MTASDRPTVHRQSETAEFLDGLARGELRLPRCTACERVGHPGERHCVRCMAESFEWIVASGRATVFSYTTIDRSFHPAFKTPYTVAVFELEEGPRLVGELVGAPPEGIEVGLHVVVDHELSASGDAPLRFHRPR